MMGARCPHPLFNWRTAAGQDMCNGPLIHAQCYGALGASMHLGIVAFRWTDMVAYGHDASKPMAHFVTSKVDPPLVHEA